MGLSGCDGNVICARKRPPLEVDGEPVDFGAVGDVVKESVNRPFLEMLLGQGLVPVLSPINHDGEGNLLNTNADTLSAAVAAALGAELWTCFEKDGVLLDINDPGSVVGRIGPEDYARLKASGAIADGMIPKLENAFKALRGGAAKVLILNADNLLKGRGTEVSL